MNVNQARFRFDVSYYDSVDTQCEKLSPPVTVERLCFSSGVKRTNFRRATTEQPKGVSFRQFTHLAEAFAALWDGATGRKSYDEICDADSRRLLPAHLRSALPGQTSINAWVDFCALVGRLDNAVLEHCDGDGDALWAAVQQKINIEAAQRAAAASITKDEERPASAPGGNFQSPPPQSPSPSSFRAGDAVSKSAVDDVGAMQGVVCPPPGASLSERLQRICAARRAELINCGVFGLITAGVCGALGFFASSTSIGPDALFPDVKLIGPLMGAVKHELLIRYWAIAATPSMMCSAVVGILAGVTTFLIWRRHCQQRSIFRRALTWPLDLSLGIIIASGCGFLITWILYVFSIGYLTSLVIPLAIARQQVGGSLDASLLCGLSGFLAGAAQAALVQVLLAKFPDAAEKLRWKVRETTDWVQYKLR